MAFRQLTAPEKELRVLFVATVHPVTLKSTDALAVLAQSRRKCDARENLTFAIFTIFSATGRWFLYNLS